MRFQGRVKVQQRDKENVPLQLPFNNAARMRLVILEGFYH